MAAKDINNDGIPEVFVNWHPHKLNVYTYADGKVKALLSTKKDLGNDSVTGYFKKTGNIGVLDIEKDVKPLAEKCMKLGCKVLLLKCGAKGMYLQTASKEKLAQISSRIELDADAWADRSIFERSYVPEKILSGTGAGDTSIAAFLTAVLQKDTPDMCLHLAAATGASCVAAYDALSGLKPLDELRDKIEKGWEKTCL